MNATKKQESPIIKGLKYLQYPILLVVAAGGIIAYNGWNVISVEPQLEYKQFKYFDSAERYLRENYGLSAQSVETFIKPYVGNYFFFQSGMMLEKVAPFQMTFLYENGFPVGKEHILWHPVDDRFMLDLNTSEVYQRDKTMFLKIEGKLVFKPRPFIDLLKIEKLKAEGFAEENGTLVKPIQYDLKLNPNER